MKTRWPTDHRTSERMKRVRRAGTKPELRVANSLRLKGLRFGSNVKSVRGSPDFCNKSRRWAIFVHGCFWHGHSNCRYATLPSKNRQQWIAKIATNQSRDRRVVRTLRAQGFVVVIVWECQTRNPAQLARLLNRVLFEHQRPI